MSHDRMYLHRILRTAAFLAGTLLFLRFLFIPLLPFLLALGLSALLEPLVQRLRRFWGVRRSFAAAFLTTALLLILGAGTVFFALRLGSELSVWSTRLPQAIESFPALWNNALNRMARWYTACPPFLRSMLDSLARALGDSAPSLVGKAGSFLMEKVSSLAAALPGVGLFAITTILALYLTAINYNTILSFLKRQLPPAWQPRCSAALECCRGAMLKWLRSELIMIFVTFSIALLGFWLLGYDFALLAAVVLALVDALPVLGTGTVLLPWSAFCFLLGDASKGLSLIALYAVMLLVRSLLEPKLLAGQANLPSIAVLLSMYLGFHFFGVSGMLLLPVLLILVKHLQDASVIRLWH